MIRALTLVAIIGCGFVAWEIERDLRLIGGKNA